MATATTKKTSSKTPVVKKTVVNKNVPKIVASPDVAQTDVSGVARYINKNLKVSPRKLRLVVTAIKKLTPDIALSRLKFTNTNAARLLAKALEDAIASAKNNHHLISSTIKFNEIRVDEGLKIKRMDKSHGSRFARGIIQKRHSRLVIVLSGTIQS